MKRILVRLGAMAALLGLLFFETGTWTIWNGRTRIPSGVRIYPGDNIQDSVDAYPAGTQFVIMNGLHRRFVCEPKSRDVFIGQSRDSAIVSGAMLIPDSLWAYGPEVNAAGDTLWNIPNQTQQGRVFSYSGANICEGDSLANGCNLPNELFRDNVALVHVLALDSVTTNDRWFFDYAADRIFVRDVTSGHLWEASADTCAITAHQPMMPVWAISTARR